MAEGHLHQGWAPPPVVSGDEDFDPIDLEVAKDGSGVYVDRGEGQLVSRSEYPHEAVTLDFSEDGTLVGVEVVARPTRDER